jgi:hypothetical protein
MNRAPEHIFDPRYPNAVIVRDLGGHQDHIVSQYTIWAICESRVLGIRDLGIPLTDIERQPPNVRGWMYRLVALSARDVKDSFEYITMGARELDIDARSGLAVGLGRTHIDGIEPIVLDWFGSEEDQEIRYRLLDHMVRHAEEVPSYRSTSLEIYKAETTGANLRQRMEAAAAGTSLYGTFKRYAITGDGDLFDGQSHYRGVTFVTNNNNNITIAGSVVGSAISQGGDANTTYYDQKTIHIVQAELAKAEREIHGAEIDEKLKTELLALIAAGSNSPTPEKLSPIVAGLKKVAGILGATGKAATGITAIVAALAKLGIIEIPL